MADNVLVKIWHDGKIRWKPKVTYQGGSLSIIQIEADKMSYFMLVGYMIENASYMSKNQFVMHYLSPGRRLEDGLVLLKNDNDVSVMMNALWEKAEHRNCVIHIYANWDKKHKGEDLKLCFRKTVKAYCEPDFKIVIEEMKELSAEAVEAFLKQNPKVFCRCYLDINIKTDVVVNNMAETFNGYIVQSRAKHIINMLEDIRVAIMTRLTKMQSTMSTRNVIVCPRIQTKLDTEKNRAYICEVFPSSTTVFQVKELDDVSVDMVNMTCTCRKWDLTGIPRFHACAVVGFLGRNAKEYVDRQYSKEMYLKVYDFPIPPLPSQKFWPTVDFPLDPPPIKIGPGRPKKNRKRDPHEDPKKPGKLTKHGCTIYCSICKVKGHNKRKCPERMKNSEPSENQQKKGTSRSKRSSQPKKTPAKRARKKTKKSNGEPSGTQQSTQTTHKPSQGILSLP